MNIQTAWECKRMAIMFVKGFIVSIILLAGLVCYSDDPKENTDIDKSGTAIGENKDIAVRAECLKTPTGSTFGFNIEIINLINDKNVVIKVHNNVKVLFDVRLLNNDGIDISPAPILLPFIHSRSNKPRYRYVIITPNTAYAWVIPVPDKVRADLTNFNDKDNLKITPEGNYMAKVRVNVNYLIQENITDTIPDYNDFNTLQMSLPKIPLVIDKNSINSDVLKAYLDKDKKAGM